ncbi:MAG: LysM peptidoglycan-binding domain-containing protein [Propionibacteriaceae bacterium]
MRWFRQLSAVTVLVVLLILFPYGLVKYGIIPNNGLQIFTQRDDGTVFLFLLTVIGWVAWGIFVIAIVAEICTLITGKRWQVPGAKWAQTLVSGLVAMAFAVTPGVTAIAAPIQPLPHDYTQINLVVTQAGTETVNTEKDIYSVELAAELYQSYVVQPGDDLWSIAVAQFNDGLQWQRLYEMNRDVIKDPDHLEAGWTLRLPGLPRTGNVKESEITESQAANLLNVDRNTDSEIEAISSDQSTDSKHDSATKLGPTAPISTNIVALAMGSFAAAAVLGAVAFRREGRELSRPLGKRFCDPTASVRRLEVAMESSANGIKISDLDVVQRAIAEYAKEAEDLPHVHYVELSNERIVIHFLHDISRAPIGFTVSERSWIIAASAVEFLRADADTPYAWPALIPVGSCDSSVTIFIDLDEAKILDVAATAIRQALTAVLLSSDQIELVTVGEKLLTKAFSGSCVVTNSEALTLLKAKDIPDIDRLSRLDRNLSDAARPRIIMTCDIDEELASANAVLCIGKHSAAAWKLDDQGLHTPYDHISINPDKLLPAEVNDLQELVLSVQSQETELAPWWSHDVDSSLTTEISSRPLSQLLVARAQEDDVPNPLYPTLYLLGPVELHGARGEIPPRAVKQCMEYAAWLMENPGATASQMSSALIVAEGTRRSNMSRLRNWLGSHEDGDPFLPDAYSGRILLSPDVSSDWQQLQLLIGPGVNRVSADSLAAALDLVRGAPLADAAPGQWIWAEPMRSQMVAVIRDIAARLAQIALDAGDYDLVRWATARGFVVAPADELLTVLRVKAEYRTGNSVEVDRLINRLAYHARSLGVDLAEETVIALQEVMEGQVRARQVSQLTAV